MTLKLPNIDFVCIYVCMCHKTSARSIKNTLKGNVKEPSSDPQNKCDLDKPSHHLSKIIYISIYRWENQSQYFDPIVDMITLKWIKNIFLYILLTEASHYSLQKETIDTVAKIGCNTKVEKDLQFMHLKLCKNSSLCTWSFAATSNAKGTFLCFRLNNRHTLMGSASLSPSPIMTTFVSHRSNNANVHITTCFVLFPPPKEQTRPLTDMGWCWHEKVYAGWHILPHTCAAAPCTYLVAASEWGETWALAVQVLWCRLTDIITGAVSNLQPSILPPFFPSFFLLQPLYTPHPPTHSHTHSSYPLSSNHYLF